MPRRGPWLCPPLGAPAPPRAISPSPPSRTKCVGFSAHMHLSLSRATAGLAGFHKGAINLAESCTFRHLLNSQERGAAAFDSILTRINSLEPLSLPVYACICLRARAQTSLIDIDPTGRACPTCRALPDTCPTMVFGSCTAVTRMVEAFPFLLPDCPTCPTKYHTRI